MKLAKNFPNQNRVRHGLFESFDHDQYGVFIIPWGYPFIAQCIVSKENGWEHVSVTIIEQPSNDSRTPTWDEMSRIKDLFWNENETTVQFHPKKSEYVNNHEHVLHIWKQVGKDFTLPPKELI